MESEIEERNSSEESFANKLAKAGETDFYVISLEDAEKLLTEKRMELIYVLKNQEVSSSRELSRVLDRDIKQVSEDLNLLHEISVIEFKQKGNRKIPQLRHKNIFIQPVV